MALIFFNKFCAATPLYNVENNMQKASLCRMKHQADYRTIGKLYATIQTISKREYGNFIYIMNPEHALCDV